VTSENFSEVELDKIREAVDVETDARFATSRIVTKKIPFITNHNLLIFNKRKRLRLVTV
jgi:hypothetical protein